MNRFIHVTMAATLMISSVLAGTALDIENSEVTWKGTKVTGSHDGDIRIKEGHVEIRKDQLIGGRIIMDMTSIRVLDIKDPKWNKKLEDHLKNEDFFTVDEFPQAQLDILSSTPKGGDRYRIKGDLTIKGITHVVEFDADLDLSSSKAIATGRMVIDRTKYDIRYKSGKFFPNLGDRTIYDDFELTFRVVTK